MRRTDNITSITTPSDRDIRDLTEALNQLRLAQSRLDAVIARVERNREQAERQEQPTPTRRRPVHPLSRFVAGDYVRVKNPRRGQPYRGIVFGATRSALIRLRATNGEEIKRLSKNLELLESADEQERTEAGDLNGHRNHSQ